MKEKLSKFRLFNPKNPFQTILPIVLCVAIVAGVIFVGNSINVFTIKEPIFRFDTGVRHDFTGRTTIERDEETGILTMKNKGNKTVLDSSPIFYTESDNKMLLPAQMAVVFPDTRKHGRSGFNMTVDKDSEGRYIAKVRGDDIDVTDAFFFDGNNTYVFLKPMTISLGIEEVEVPAYTHAYVYYDLRVELYSRDESVNVVVHTGEVIVTATSKDNSYEIDLSKDILRTSEGEILLITDPSVLNYVKPEMGMK